LDLWRYLARSRFKWKVGLQTEGKVAVVAVIPVVFDLELAVDPIRVDRRAEHLAAQPGWLVYDQSRGYTGRVDERLDGIPKTLEGELLGLDPRDKFATS